MAVDTDLFERIAQPFTDRDTDCRRWTLVDHVDQARELLRACPPDVLIYQGGRGAVQHVAAMHELAPSCAIIVLVAVDDAVTAHRLLSAGAQEVFGRESCFDHLPQVASRAVRRARAHASVWESQQRLRAVFDAMTSGVLVTTGDDRVIEANRAAQSLLGVARGAALVGDKLMDVAPWATDLVRSGSQDRASIPVQLPDGSARLLGYSTVQTASGARVTVFRDLTELGMAEERRRRAEQLAQVGEAAARLGHEIKNPLTSCLVGLQIVESASELPRALREIVQCSLEELQTASGVIGELLSSARTTPLSPQLVAVPPLLHEAIDPYRSFSARRNVAIRLELPTDPEVWIAADPLWLRRAFTNLLVNAIEACSPGGTVCVSARVLSEHSARARLPGYPGRVVGIQVTDDGNGIAAQEIDRIFEPFHTTKRSGTGLGLAVALDALESHGGAMEVASEPGHGASFEMLLPLVDPLVPDGEGPWPCGQRPEGIAHGCWMALGHEEFVRTGGWPAVCRSCSVFRGSNLARFTLASAPGRTGE